MAKIKVSNQKMIELVKQFLEECETSDKTGMNSPVLTMKAQKILEQSKNSYRG